MLIFFLILFDSFLEKNHSFVYYFEWRQQKGKIMSQVREHWGSKLGFIMASAGSAIGLGSLWKFPYIVGQNGGGAFVILYILFTILIGLPVFTSELVLGRHSQHGAIRTYETLSSSKENWKMLGWLNLTSCFIILAYYSVVAGWCFSYILMSLNEFYIAKSPAQIREMFNILYASPSMNVLWLGLFLLLNVGVVYSGVRRGIEHWSKILTPGFLIIILCLFFYSMTLSGFKDAAHFIFYPDFTKITPSSILNALGMAFFTLSVGLGIILTYGSYMKPTEDIPQTAFIVALMTLVVSLIGAMTIFPIVFTFKFPPQAGPGLIFQTMPILFSKLPGSLVISTVFFSLLLFVALTSSISLLEMIVANLMEVYHWTRSKSTLIGTLITFLIGIPCALSGSNVLFPKWTMIYGKNFFDTLEYVSSAWMMPISGLLTTLFVGWFLDRKLFDEEFTRGAKGFAKLLHPWYFSVRWVAPVIVVFIILEQTGVININSLFTFFSH